MEGQHKSTEKSLSTKLNPPALNQQSKTPTNRSKDKKPRVPKWVKLGVAISISLINFGSFYIYDVPQELSEQLMTKYQVNQTQLNLTYSLYYLPNILFMLIIPYFASKLQTSYVLFISASVMFFGSIVSAAAIEVDNWNWMLAGRLVFGIGAEICITSTDEFIEDWYKSGGISLITSIYLVVNQIAIAVSNYSSVPLFYSDRNLFTPFAVSCLTCLLSVVATFVLMLLDNYKIGLLSSRKVSSGSGASVKSRVTVGSELTAAGEGLKLGASLGTQRSGSTLRVGGDGEEDRGLLELNKNGKDPQDINEVKKKSVKNFQNFNFFR